MLKVTISLGANHFEVEGEINFTDVVPLIQLWIGKPELDLSSAITRLQSDAQKLTAAAATLSTTTGNLSSLAVVPDPNLPAQP